MLVVSGRRRGSEAASRDAAGLAREIEFNPSILSIIISFILGSNILSVFLM